MAITVVSSAPPATTSSSPLSPQQEKASDVFSQLLGERLSADKAVEALVSDPKSIDSKVSSALAASPQTSEITGLSTKEGTQKEQDLSKDLQAAITNLMMIGVPSHPVLTRNQNNTPAQKTPTLDQAALTPPDQSLMSVATAVSSDPALDGMYENLLDEIDFASGLFGKKEKNLSKETFAALTNSAEDPVDLLMSMEQKTAPTSTPFSPISLDKQPSTALAPAATATTSIDPLAAKLFLSTEVAQPQKNLPVVDTSLPAFADETASTPVAPNVVTSLLTPQEKPHMQSSEAAKVLHVHTPMSPDPKWGKELGQNLLMMVNTKMDVAQMQVNPPNLGPIEVSLRLHQDQASVLFVAATPQAKDTLEQHLPRLAAMLADNGIQLNGAQVSSGDSQERQAAQMAFMQQNQSSRQDESAPKFSVHGMPTAAPVSPPVTPAPVKSVDGDDQLSVYA